MPPATPRYARIKLSRTWRSSMGSLARIRSTVGSGLDLGRTSATALPSTDSRLALWWGPRRHGRAQTQVGAWSLRPQARSSVGREGCGGQTSGTPLPIGKIGWSPASDRRTVQTVPGPARSLIGWTPRGLGGRPAPLDLRSHISVWWRI